MSNEKRKLRIEQTINGDWAWVDACGVVGVTKFQTRAAAIDHGRLYFPDEVEETPVDIINHPPHYKKHPSGVECITITEHFNFNLGNTIKYVWRAGEKGDALEDLQKAAWYLAREIWRRGGKATDVDAAKKLQEIQALLDGGPDKVLASTGRDKLAADIMEIIRK